MADNASVRTGLDTLIAENWSSTVMDNLFDITPAFAAFITRNGQSKKSVEGLGVPDSGLVLTGVKSAKPRKKEILSSLIYQPMIHHLLPTKADGKVMGLYDNMPTRSDWENTGPERRFKRPSVKWCEIADPCKVSNEIIRHTKRTSAGERNGWEAIGDLFKVENSDVLGQHMHRWSEMLWGTAGAEDAQGLSATGAPSNEDDDKWDALYSFKNACKADNTYCGVDRSLSGGSYFRGNYITTATSPVFRDMIRDANYGTPALAKKNKGLDAIFVGSTLFQYALAEVDNKVGGQIIRAGEAIPEFGQFGWKRDIVKIDNTHIIFDPGCPANEAFGVNFKTWTLAIHPDANFKQSTPTDQSNTEGGDDAHTWTLRTKLLLVCEDPSGNVYWTNVA
jgi:hypothetical protein